jgi:hypothetical protein
MENKSYNGWTNRETWSCSINLRNDYTTNKLIEAYISEAKSVERLEFFIKSYVRIIYSLKNCFPEGRIYKIAEDIGAFEDINFKEIAEAYFDEKRVS